MSQQAWKGQDLIVFLERLMPKALRLDRKENLLKDHVGLQENPLLMMEHPRENTFWVVLNFSSWKMLSGAHINTAFFKNKIKYSLSLPYLQ